MEAWWGSLDAALKVFYAIGIASGAVLLVQLALLLLGFDADHADIAESGESSVLSLRTVTAFFVGFGWTGVALVKAGHSVPIATAGGLLMGTAFMASVFFLMRLLYGLQKSGTIDYRNAIGSSGKVYVPIPPRMERPGQVEVLVQGRLRFVDALTREDRVLPRDARVRVVDLVDATTLLVEPE